MTPFLYEKFSHFSMECKINSKRDWTGACVNFFDRSYKWYPSPTKVEEEIFDESDSYSENLIFRSLDEKLLRTVCNSVLYMVWYARWYWVSSIFREFLELLVLYHRPSGTFLCWSFLFTCSFPNFAQYICGRLPLTQETQRKGLSKFRIEGLMDLAMTIHVFFTSIAFS